MKKQQLFKYRLFSAVLMLNKANMTSLKDLTITVFERFCGTVPSC